MSAQRREPGHDPFKSLKIFVFSSDKASDILMMSLKAFMMLVFVITSISLVVYSIFGGQSRWWSDYPGDCPTRNTFQPTHLSQSELSEPTNISHIVFGIGASSNTWQHRRQYSQLWWQSNVTRGYILLDKKPDPNLEWPESSPPYRVSEDWSRFKFSSSQSGVRIARIVVELFQIGLPEVRWFVMGDDDTVFFTDNLITVLAKYDHREMYYIGGNSESVEQDVMHSYGMAFGGGGFAVSYPLAAELAKAMDGCLDRYYRFYGSDQRVWACVSEFGVSLTKEPGFHQIDVRGDAYGLLAAHPVAPLVTLHHLNYVKPLFPNQSQLESVKTLMQAYRVDPARTMQQSVCYYKAWGGSNWSISISWGYTIQLYTSFLLATDLEIPLQTFQTWRSWGNGPFTFNTRPVSADPCEQPLIYYLDWIQEVSETETLTSYKRFVDEPRKKCGKADYRRAVERIVVSALKMDPEKFKKAPRRQCCEINSFKYGKMKIGIRSCRPSEAVSN